MIDGRSDIWIVIVGMAIGTFLIRFSFIGLVGDRDLPPWVLRLLRFTPIAVLPAVVSPMLIDTSGGELDPLRMIAAVTTLVVGYKTRSVLYAILAGLGAFFGLSAVF